MWDSSCVLAKHSNKDKTLPNSAGFCVNLHRLLRNPGQKEDFYKTFTYRIFSTDETEALTSYATWQFTPKAQFLLPQLAKSLIKIPRITRRWFMVYHRNTSHTELLQARMVEVRWASWAAGAATAYVTVLRNKFSGKQARFFWTCHLGPLLHQLNKLLPASWTQSRPWRLLPP